jgi:hypothetical protein
MEKIYSCIRGKKISPLIHELKTNKDIIDKDSFVYSRETFSCIRGKH